MNVQEIGTNGTLARSLCFLPKGGVVAGDVVSGSSAPIDLLP
jgi:hypothetical protein